MTGFMLVNVHQPLTIARFFSLRPGPTDRLKVRLLQSSSAMARFSGLVLLVACALLGSHVSTLLFVNAPATQKRLRTAARAVDERDEGLVLIKPEESGKASDCFQGIKISG